MALAAACAMSACGPGDAEEGAAAASAVGRLVIVGGALQAENAAVYQAIVEGRGGEGPPCVTPTASSDPLEAMEGAVERLEAYGGVGSARGILISTEDPSRARDPEAVAELGACSGFFFTGGSQSRVLDVFLPEGDTTEAYRALWRRWQEGAVVSGTSAGAAMMSQVMISGGNSNEAVAHGIAVGDDAEGVEIRDGMGFFPPGMLDQHFLARGRIGRLLVSVLDEDTPPIGLGIDENTAMVVDGDSAAVVGASGVVLVDGRMARRMGPDRGSGLRVALAGAGDVIDLSTFEVRREGAKVPVPVIRASMDLPEDPFARWAFLHLLVDLASSEDPGAMFALPEATLQVVEEDGFSAAMTGATGGVEGTPAGFSAGPFRVDVLGPGPR
jgi:cyanophycinase